MEEVVSGGEDYGGKAHQLIQAISQQKKKLNLTPSDFEFYYSEVVSKTLNHFPWLYNYIDDSLNGASEKQLKAMAMLIKKFLLGFHKKPQINEICQCILDNWDKKITTEFLSSELNLSKHYVGELFKEQTGVSLKGYITDVKIERAKCLLMNREDSWSDITEKVNYSNAGYFALVFKDRTGYSPQKYRKLKCLNNG